MVEMGCQMACFRPFREIGPVCPRATGGPRMQQVVPLPKINLCGRDDLSGEDGTANGLLWTLFGNWSSSMWSDEGLGGPRYLG